VNKHPDRQGIATAGLPETTPYASQALRETGIDPDRLSVARLGVIYRFSATPYWLFRLVFGLCLWGLQFFILRQFPHTAPSIVAAMQLFTGLIILMVACETLVTATERLAARYHWNHYTAGTLAEILSTTPELVVIAFIIPVSPVTAFVICLMTIYNNSLVFSL